MRTGANWSRDHSRQGKQGDQPAESAEEDEDGDPRRDAGGCVPLLAGSGSRMRRVGHRRRSLHGAGPGAASIGK